MKVTARQADSFARNPDPAAHAILVYGPDAGLVIERMKALIASALDDPTDPFRRVDLAGDVLESDPARLADEAAALSMTGGRRVVVVRGAGDRQTAAFAAVIEGARGEALIVVEAGDLGPRSSLRRVFEGSGGAAALPCYADDAGSLAELIRRTLGEDGITADGAAVEYLVGQLGGDRLLSRSELEKLALYAGAGATVTVEDARSVVGDASAMSVDEVADAAAGGHRELLDELLDRSFRFGNKPASVLGVMSRHLQKLRIVLVEVDAGQTVDRAIKGLRPPVFFKRRAAMERQVRLWRSATLARALEIVSEAELEFRTTAMPDQALCARALFQISRGALMR